MTTRADLIETMARAAYEAEPATYHLGNKLQAFSWANLNDYYPEIAKSYRKAAEKSVEAIGAGGLAIVPREADDLCRRAYRNALRKFIQTIPVEAREEKFGWAKKKNGTRYYRVPDSDKADCRYRAMVHAVNLLAVPTDLVPSPKPETEA